MKRYPAAAAVLVVTVYYIKNHSFQSVDAYNEYNFATNPNNPFVGFYIFPHGGVTLDPVNTNYSDQPAFHPGSQEKAIKLHYAMRNASEALISLKPDLIIFSTPHGFRLEDKEAISASVKAAGNAGDIWTNFTASFDINTNLSSFLYKELKSKGNGVEYLTFASPDYPLPLFWAEVIPFYFIREAASRANFPLPSAVYIGQPRGVTLPSLIKLGSDIVKTILPRADLTSQRIAVVVSGDMSHYHSNDSTSPYPYSPLAEPFDNFLVNWANLDQNQSTKRDCDKEIIENAGSIRDQVGTCGYNGFLMLHGIIGELLNHGWNYKAIFYGYELPSYFGMMVASWIPA